MRQVPEASWSNHLFEKSNESKVLLNGTVINIIIATIESWLILNK